MSLGTFLGNVDSLARVKTAGNISELRNSFNSQQLQKKLAVQEGENGV